MSEVLDGLSARGSAWTRADVIRAICDVQRPVSSIPGHEWAAAVERAADQVLDALRGSRPGRLGSAARFGWPVGVGRADRRPVQLRGDPGRGRTHPHLGARRPGRAADPVAHRDDRRVGRPASRRRRAVAGQDRLVVVVGPAGAGKTTMLARAVDDLDRQGRAVFGVAPTAKAAQVLGHETGMATDTLAKLAPRMDPPRPPTPARLPARRGSDGDRGRGRHGRHPEPRPSRRPRRDASVAAGAGR